MTSWSPGVLKAARTQSEAVSLVWVASRADTSLGHCLPSSEVAHVPGHPHRQERLVAGERSLEGSLDPLP